MLDGMAVSIWSAVLLEKRSMATKSVSCDAVEDEVALRSLAVLRI